MDFDLSAALGVVAAGIGGGGATAGAHR